jgi:hypothetical protein
MSDSTLNEIEWQKKYGSELPDGFDLPLSIPVALRSLRRRTAMATQRLPRAKSQTTLSKPVLPKLRSFSIQSSGRRVKLSPPPRRKR